MKRFLIACLLLALVVPIAAQTTPKPATNTSSTAEQDIRKVLADWLAAEAKGDGEALARIISPNFLGMGPGGNPVTYHDLVPSTGEDRPPAFQGATLGETTIQVQGDTAVVLSGLEMKGAQAGKMRFSMVFKRQAGGPWQIISAHLGPRQTAE